MTSPEALLLAVVVCLVVLLVLQFRSKQEIKHKCGPRCATHAHPERRAKFTGNPNFPGDPPNNPYTVLNKQIDDLRGSKNDGFGQPPIWRQPHGLDRYHRSGARLKPEDIANAEREQWYGETSRAGIQTYDPSAGADIAGDAVQYHTAAPAMDYGTFITDLVIDPRTKENHAKWVSEMQPWSGTAMMVDDLDEAQEATTDFIGLRRPQPVAVYNPVSLTERDTMTFIGNKRFNFVD